MKTDSDLIRDFIKELRDIARYIKISYSDSKPYVYSGELGPEQVIERNHKAAQLLEDALGNTYPFYPKMEYVKGLGTEEPCVVLGSGPDSNPQGWYGFARGYSGILYWYTHGVAYKAGNINCSERYDLTQRSLNRLKECSL